MLNAILGIVSGIGSLTYAWYFVATIAALAVIAVLALIYEISPMLGRTDLRIWTRIKIYDVLISIVFMLIFLLIFVAFFAGINAVSAFGKNFVPNACNDQTNTDIYALAMCDLSQFNSQIANVNNLGFFLMLLGSTSGSYKVEQPIGWLTISAALSMTPSGILGPLTVYLSAFFAFYILSRVMLLLLSIGLLIFSVFMAIGLISRLFVVTRTFGGAMIAFAIGIGIIFPLVIATIYGFLDVTIQNIPATDFISLIVQTVFLALSVAIGAASALTGATTILSGSASFIAYIGYVFAGMLLFPIVSLTLVDVFIRDFSASIGERMDFLSILTSLV
ncbi:MAG: hypothetical protein ACP5T4_00470 [Candidatus Micrarchaeia archaeon]